MATRQRYGFCGSPACSPSSWLLSRCCVAASRSSRSRCSSLRPTCMSAVPRSTGSALLRRKLQRPLVGAHRLAETTLRDPDVRQGDRAAERCRRCARPAADPPCPRRTSGAPPRGPRSSRRRAPGAPPPRRASRWSSSGRGRAPAGRSCTVSATSPRARAWPARCTAIEPGRRRNPSSSTTTIPADGRPVAHVAASRVQPPFGVPQAGLDAVELAARQQGPGVGVAEHGPVADSSSGSASSQPSSVASCRLRRSAGAASSTRSAARAKSRRPGRGGSPRTARRCCSYHALARRCSSATWSGCSSSQARAQHVARRGGGSGTTGAGRRAGRRTGCRAPAPPAWPCRRPGR